MFPDRAVCTVQAPATAGEPPHRPVGDRYTCTLSFPPKEFEWMFWDGSVPQVRVEDGGARARPRACHRARAHLLAVSGRRWFCGR